MDLLVLALANLATRKKRAVLTMLGIFIGIAAVVALVSLGNGLQYTINAQFEKVGADKIILQPKEAGFGDINAPGLFKEHELNIVKKTHGVKEATSCLFIAAQVQFNNLQRTLYVMSIPETHDEVELSTAFHAMEAETGRLLMHKDKQNVVLGHALGNKKVFGKNINVGEKIILNEETFEVTGILKRIGDPFMDSVVVMPQIDAKRVLNAPNAFQMMLVQAEKNTNPEEVADRIEKVLRRERNQKEGKENFTVQTSTDLIDAFNKVLNIIQVVFAGIAAISLLVAGIGIMNTMYTAVLERTKEIGVMKAIGARNNDVLMLFLLESGLLGLAGGIVGVLIGIGISKGVELAANYAFGAGTITAVYPAYLIVGALFFSALIGTFSGLMPARRAAKLKPVDALRYE